MREKLEDLDERRKTARPVTAKRAVAGRCNFNALITARYLLLQFKIINTKSSLAVVVSNKLKSFALRLAFDFKIT